MHTYKSGYSWILVGTKHTLSIREVYPLFSVEARHICCKRKEKKIIKLLFEPSLRIIACRSLEGFEGQLFLTKHYFQPLVKYSNSSTIPLLSLTSSLLKMYIILDL